MGIDQLAAKPSSPASSPPQSATPPLPPPTPPAATTAKPGSVMSSRYIADAVAQMASTQNCLNLVQEALAQEKELLEEERQAFEEEKRAMMVMVTSEDDVVELNVGGTPMTTSRSTLSRVEGSLLAAMFSGRWEGQLKRDSHGTIFLDVDPYCMRKLLTHLRHVGMAGPHTVHPPHIEPDMADYWMCLVEFLGVKDFIYSPSPALPVELRCVFVSNGNAIMVEQGAQRVTNTTEGHKAVVCEPAMSNTSVWRVAIRSLDHSKWVMLGVNSRPNPDDGYSGDTTYGWAGHDQVYMPHNQKGHGGWGRFTQGDMVIMKLDMVASTLHMHVPRLDQTFRIKLNPQPTWYFYINFYGQSDSVDILPAKSNDDALFH